MEGNRAETDFLSTKVLINDSRIDRVLRKPVGLLSRSDLVIWPVSENWWQVRLSRLTTKFGNVMGIRLGN
jgi:hypothetical protein